MLLNMAYFYMARTIRTTDMYLSRNITEHHSGNRGASHGV